jgi:hypothetical protein
MDKLDKLNNLIAQVDARMEQIDETTLNESQKNTLEEYKAKNLKQQAAIAIAKKEKED